MTSSSPRESSVSSALSGLMEMIREAHSETDWCDLEKAQTMGSIVISFRPRTICEVGVWAGGSLVPMLLALRTLEEIDQAAARPPIRRRAVAIDAWSREESIAGQENSYLTWWREANHEDALQEFLGRIDLRGVSGLCDIIRAPSGKAPVPVQIDLLHLDGNHASQMARDVKRFCPSVPVGGILVLGYLDWRVNDSEHARELARSLGFADLYELGAGMVMQRIRKESR